MKKQLVSKVSVLILGSLMTYSSQAVANYSNNLAGSSAAPDLSQTRGLSQNQAVPGLSIPPKNLRTPYQVLPGDSLYTIAIKFYGNGSLDNIQKIADANNLQNSSLILPGQTLVIPR